MNITPAMFLHGVYTHSYPSSDPPRKVRYACVVMLFTLPSHRSRGPWTRNNDKRRAVRGALNRGGVVDEDDGGVGSCLNESIRRLRDRAVIQAHVRMGRVHGVAQPTIGGQVTRRTGHGQDITNRSIRRLTATRAIGMDKTSQSPLH